MNKNFSASQSQSLTKDKWINCRRKLANHILNETTNSNDYNTIFIIKI